MMLRVVALLECVLSTSGAGLTSPSETLEITAYRPKASSWKRTQCGSPAGKHPAVPAGSYTMNWDIPYNDISNTVLPAAASHTDCEEKCKSTAACVAYVFAPANCSGKPGPWCFLKSAVGGGYAASCRNSRVLGGPASGGSDIPSKWTAEVSATTTPLIAYPRPQMARGSASSRTELRDSGDASLWTNLNGLWEWEPTSAGSPPPLGKPLKDSILVPFPVESCLSGVAPTSSAGIVMHMWYRLTFDANRVSKAGTNGRTLLHFGAVDWQAAVYLNGHLLGNHTGGYDGFSFEITNVLKSSANELLVYVYDPSDTGAQPNGKQRISAISSPGGDTYTPSSGIWQTVWLEAVPATYISGVNINQASTSAVIVSVDVSSPQNGDSVKFSVIDAAGKIVSSTSGGIGASVTIPITQAQLWSPKNPYLYDLDISIVNAGTIDDTVTAYFGLRTFGLGDGPKGKRPLLNGKFMFMAGFLDQSWWPDGQYTAPTDDALASDVAAVPMFGMNMIRLHQKVNPERWYYHADKIGVVVIQDMVQKYGGASEQTIPYFVSDFTAMVKGRKNHPCIVQFVTFNEGDCYGVFKDKPLDVAGIVSLSKQLDPTRLVDTDSGGGANDLHIGDVNDVHSYPWPADPMPSDHQYAMIGEFGGIGAFVKGREWQPNGCFSYMPMATPTDHASTYIKMAEQILSRIDHVSASVYTQTTDLENECDGFLNYDRTNKFSEDDTAAIRTANQAIINNQAPPSPPPAPGPAQPYCSHPELDSCASTCCNTSQAFAPSAWDCWTCQSAPENATNPNCPNCWKYNMLPACLGCYNKPTPSPAPPSPPPAPGPAQPYCSHPELDSCASTCCNTSQAFAPSAWDCWTCQSAPENATNPNCPNCWKYNMLPACLGCYNKPTAAIRTANQAIINNQAVDIVV